MQFQIKALKIQREYKFKKFLKLFNFVYIFTFTDT